MGDTLKKWNNQKLIFRLLMHGLRNQIFTLRLRVLYLQYKIVLSIEIPAFEFKLTANKSNGSTGVGTVGDRLGAGG
jgi:hypothetical protein